MGEEEASVVARRLVFKPDDFLTLKCSIAHITISGPQEIASIVKRIIQLPKMRGDNDMGSWFLCVGLE